MHAPPWLYVDDRGYGAPVVLLHGYALTSRSWDAVAERLQPHARVIRPDLRGFGKSSPGEGPYSMEQMADDVALLLHDRGIERATLVGHSMGGIPVMAFARAYPERVAGLGLIDSRIERDTDEQSARRLALAERAANEGLGAIATSYVPKFFAPSVYTDRPDLVARAHAGFDDHDTASAAAAFAASVRRFDGLEVLATLDVPVLVLSGIEDGFFKPDTQRAIAASARDAELVLLDGVGHMPIWEAPEATADAILRLLARVREREAARRT